MRIVNKVLDFLAVFFLVLSLILIVDLGFDIEEGVASVPTSFSAMALITKC